MAQIDNKFTAIWYDTSTGPGTPLTGLSATILIRRKDTNVVVVNNEPMTHIGLGEYDYEYEDMDSSLAYSYVMNPNSTSALIQSGFIDPRIAYLNKSISEIAVGWNPYIQGISNIKPGIEAISKQIEEKGNEVMKKMGEEVKTIVIPEQKEPVVNVTTEKIDTEGFMKAIQAIKPEVNVTTESVDISPILTAIGNIPQPIIPEPKEVDFSLITDGIRDLHDEIKDVKEDILEKLGARKKIYEAIGGLFEQVVNKDTEDDKEEDKNEKENEGPMFPSSFTATLN